MNEALAAWNLVGQGATMPKVGLPVGSQWRRHTRRDRKQKAAQRVAISMHMSMRPALEHSLDSNPVPRKWGCEPYTKSRHNSRVQEAAAPKPALRLPYR